MENHKKMENTLEDVLKKFNKGKENEAVVKMADKKKIKKDYL